MKIFKTSRDIDKVPMSAKICPVYVSPILLDIVNRQDISSFSSFFRANYNPIKLKLKLTFKCLQNCTEKEKTAFTVE